MQINLQSDIAEQRITEGDIAPATHALHTASMPPAGDTSIKYHCGVENGKSYRHHASASHNNTLLKWCNDPDTTVADFNNHILAAAACLSARPDSNLLPTDWPAPGWRSRAAFPSHP